jgi:hypothetical protein
MSVNFTLDELKALIQKSKNGTKSAKTYKSWVGRLIHVGVHDFNTVNEDPFSIARTFQEKKLDYDYCVDAFKAIKHCAEDIDKTYPNIKVNPDLLSMSAQAIAETAYPKKVSQKAKKDEAPTKTVTVVKKDQEGNIVDGDEDSLSNIEEDDTPLETESPSTNQKGDESNASDDIDKARSIHELKTKLKDQNKCINSLRDTFDQENKVLKDRITELEQLMDIIITSISDSNVTRCLLMYYRGKNKEV